MSRIYDPSPIQVFNQILKMFALSTILFTVIAFASSVHAQQPTQQPLCYTKLGKKSVQNVPTSTYTITLPVTVTTKSTSTPVTTSTTTQAVTGNILLQAAALSNKTSLCDQSLDHHSNFNEHSSHDDSGRFHFDYYRTDSSRIHAYFTGRRLCPQDQRS